MLSLRYTPWTVDRGPPLLSNKDEHTRERTTDTRLPPKGWTGLQRLEGEAVLGWLDREQRLHRGFDTLAKGLRETLRRQLRTATDAREIWQAVPAVTARCNDPATYLKRQVGAAYGWLHLLDRYVRTWLALEHLLRDRLLPMGRYGVRVLDVGTGPGPSAFVTHDFYAALEDYARIADAGRWRQPPDVTCVEPAITMNHFRHVLAEALTVNGAPRSILAMAGGLDDFSSVRPRQERRELEARLRDGYEEYYDSERDEWHADPTHTAEEANLAANSYRRYRLFTFSNFLTTLDTVATFQADVEEILKDAQPGSVLASCAESVGEDRVLRPAVV